MNEQYEDIMDLFDGDVMTGILHAPGRFEGSHWTTVALWESAMDGFSDQILYLDDLPYDIFVLDDEDRELYNIPANISHVVLWQDSHGFVLTEWMDEAEFSFLLSIY